MQTSFGQNIYQLFVDFSSAFNTIDYDKLLNVIIEAIKDFYGNASTECHMGSHLPSRSTEAVAARPSRDDISTSVGSDQSHSVLLGNLTFQVLLYSPWNGLRKPQISGIGYYPASPESLISSAACSLVKPICKKLYFHHPSLSSIAYQSN